MLQRKEYYSVNQIILEMEKLLKRKINFFDGIYGKNIDLDKLDIFDPNLI